MKHQRLLRVAAVACGLLSTSALPALATPIFTSGSFAVTAFTPTTTDVTTTTSFALSPANMFLGSPAGDFGLAVLPVLLPLTNPLDFLVPADFNFTDAGLGTFTASTATLLSTVSGVSASATWNVTGSFMTGTDWTNVGDVLTANETWSLTQSGGPNNAISMSGTFHSPAAPVTVSEPGTLALMGLGIFVVGVFARRKANTPATQLVAV